MSKKLKIGLFIDTFFPMVDGVVMVVDNYARRLSKFCDVTVFAPIGREKYDDSKLPYKVVRCKKRLPVFFLDYDLPLPLMDKQFKKAIDEAKLDLIHIHSPFSIGKLAVNYAKKNNIPTVATMHSQFKQDFKKAVKLNFVANMMTSSIMKVFNKCDECWAVNSTIAKIFYDYGAKTMPGVQNNGTDMVYFDDQNEIKNLRQKYDIKDDQKVFLFIGRIIDLKNIFFIEKALKLLKERGFDYKMFYVGTGPDQEKLKKQVKDDGLENDIIFTGKITDRVEISKYYQMADLFLFPSLYDASSLVQIEAASQKTPTIFLKGSATSATITEDVNGYVSENSVDAFAQKIVDIFSDKNKYQEICENAYRDLYVSWDNAVQKAYNDYLRVIENKKG